jgi:polysaccharide export outer membrane protein
MDWHMRSQRLISIVLLSALIGVPSTRLNGQSETLAVGTDAAAASSPVKPNTSANEYVIGSDDVLAVNVWREPEISRTLPVRPDGNISLPLVGDLLASGHTPDQLQKEIKRQLLAYFSNPEVTVVVQEAKSHRFNIVGEVEKPGSYVMSSSMTVLDAIALAGGLRDFARATKIYVLRVSPDGSRARLPFNYKHVIKGSNLQQNVELEPHDTIVVP